MKDLIKTTLKKEYPVSISIEQIKELSNIVTSFEVRKEHPLALNSPYLGVHRIYFTLEDRKALFDLFNKDEQSFIKVLYSIKSIPVEFNVTSDGFNLFCVWLLHNILISTKLPSKYKELGAKKILIYLQYKFFTSVVNRHFKHGANEEYMKAVIQSLNYKYDIISKGTWKKVIYDRAEDFLSKNSIHYKTINKMDNDKDVLYFVSDLQTRIRNQIKAISILYYQYKEQYEYIKSSTPYENVDDEKLIKEPVSVFSNMYFHVRSLIKNNVLVHKYLLILDKLFKNISVNLLKVTIIYIHNLYAEQNKTKNKTAYKLNKDGIKIYIDINTLLEETIKNSFMYCLQQNINMKNPLIILNTLKKLYSSSRLKDENILSIKYSFINIIEKSKITRREATISSLHIAVILYIILLSLEVLNKD